jgi:hypothetical protein
VPRFVSTQRAVLGSVGEKPDRGPVAFQYTRSSARRFCDKIA